MLTSGSVSCTQAKDRVFLHMQEAYLCPVETRIGSRHTVGWSFALWKIEDVARGSLFIRCEVHEISSGRGMHIKYPVLLSCGLWPQYGSRILPAPRSVSFNLACYVGLDSEGS